MDSFTVPFNIKGKLHDSGHSNRKKEPCINTWSIYLRIHPWRFIPGKILLFPNCSLNQRDYESNRSHFDIYHFTWQVLEEPNIVHWNSDSPNFRGALLPTFQPVNSYRFWSSTKTNNSYQNHAWDRSWSGQFPWPAWLLYPLQEKFYKYPILRMV